MRTWPPGAVPRWPPPGRRGVGRPQRMDDASLGRHRGDAVAFHGHHPPEPLGGQQPGGLERAVNASVVRAPGRQAPQPRREGGIDERVAPVREADSEIDSVHIDLGKAGQDEPFQRHRPEVRVVRRLGDDDRPLSPVEQPLQRVQSPGSVGPIIQDVARRLARLRREGRRSLRRSACRVVGGLPPGQGASIGTVSSAEAPYRRWHAIVSLLHPGSRLATPSSSASSARRASVSCAVRSPATCATRAVASPHGRRLCRVRGEHATRWECCRFRLRRWAYPFADTTKEDGRR